MAELNGKMTVQAQPLIGAAAAPQMPANTIWYQLLTPSKIINPNVQGPQVEVVAASGDLNALTGEVVRLGLMNRPHAITFTTVLKSTI